MNRLHGCRRVVGMFCALTLGGCAIINPYITDVDPAPLQTYQAAKANARQTIGEFGKKLKDVEQFDFWSGIAGLAAAVTGTAFGTLGGSRDSIIIAALAGGTVLGIRAFIPTSERKQIYIGGAAAIECAISATSLPDKDQSGLGTTNVERITSELSRVRSQIRTDLRRSGVQAADAAFGAFALLRLDQMDIVRKQSIRELTAFEQAVEEFVDERADRLERARIAVIHAVNFEIAEEGLDVNAAIDAARENVAPEKASQLQEQGKQAIEENEVMIREAEAAASAAMQARALEGDHALEEPMSLVPKIAKDAQEEATSRIQRIKELLAFLTDLDECFGQAKG